MAIVVGTKKWIRKKFIEETGRFDLVQDLTDYADNGADFFIDAACRILDMFIEHPKSIKRYQADLSEGDYLVEMKYLRSVEKVEVMNADGRSELTPMSYSDFRDTYNEDFSSMDKGTPNAYALNVNALAPEQKAISDFASSFSFDTEGLRAYSDDVFTYDGIIFAPPADGTYTMTIHAYFYSHLESDDDKNYYSVNFPILLILAAKLVLFSMYDNSSGFNDVWKAINLYIEAMDRNVINSELSRAGLKRKGL